MTTPSTKKKYKLYVEMNNENINQINSILQKTKSFSGYNLGNTTYTNGTCPTLPNGNSYNPNDPLYPIQGSYQGKKTIQNGTTGTLSLSDFPMPSGSFNRGWLDYKGSDQIQYYCPGGYISQINTQYTGTYKQVYTEITNSGSGCNAAPPSYENTYFQPDSFIDSSWDAQ